MWYNQLYQISILFRYTTLCLHFTYILPTLLLDYTYIVLPQYIYIGIYIYGTCPPILNMGTGIG